MAKEAVKPTKVVVRLLPPLITENELMATIGDEHRSNVSIKNFVPGKRVKGESKPSRNATCYLYFGDTDQADLFIRAYHGHAFVDDQGEHFRAVACYAPYQKVPKQKSAKEDPREGKIEEDAIYKQFLETLAKPKEAFVAPEDPKLAAKPLDPAATPLLQHLRDKAKERRERAERKANKKWKSQMDSIGEDEEVPRKKGKWFCGECGTTKKLEEDPDDRGTFYCTRCWESWETADWDSKPKKKKKKNKYYEEVEEVVEETSSSRKSKKKKEKEAAHDWYAEEASKEQASEGRRRRKKKEKEEEWWDEGSNSYWKESDEGYSREKKSKSKREKSQWVEVDSKEKKSKAEEDPPASRWRKKGASAEEETQEEKPRRSRRSKAKEDDYWY